MPRPSVLQEIENTEENARTYTDTEIEEYMAVSNVEPTNGAMLWMKVID